MLLWLRLNSSSSSSVLSLFLLSFFYLISSSFFYLISSFFLAFVRLTSACPRALCADARFRKKDFREGYTKHNNDIILMIGTYEPFSGDSLLLLHVVTRNVKLSVSLSFVALFI